MRFTLGCNWDPRLLEGAPGDRLKSLFGGMPDTPVAGGRGSFVAPLVSKETVQSYVREAHGRGLAFDFLLNASCLDNREYQRTGYAEIVDHIEWVASIGVDSVILSIPFLAQILAKRFPKLPFKVSSFARVDSLQKARFWEEMGAVGITLPENANRDFRFLEELRRHTRLELILIANPGCLYGCHQMLHHANTMTHASQSGHPSEGFIIDSCYFTCTVYKMGHPTEIVKARWIRPEDAARYDGLADTLKIIDRYKTTEVLLSYLDAYRKGRWEGNLVDLLNLPKRKAFLPANLQYLMRDDLVNTERLMSFADITDLTVSELIEVENAKIPPDFLDFFRQVDCARTDCETCGYCARIAAAAVRTKAPGLETQRAKFEKLVGDLASGSIFDEGEVETEEGTDAEAETEDEAEAGTNARLDKKAPILWSEEARGIHDRITEVIPWGVRALATRLVKRRSEKNARARGSNRVAAEDNLNAWLAETPLAFRSSLRQSLTDLGFSDWAEKV